MEVNISIELRYAASFVALGVLVARVVPKYISKYSNRWHNLPDSTKKVVILRLAQSPPKILYLWASWRAYWCTDEALLLDHDRARALAYTTT